MSRKIIFVLMYHRHKLLDLTCLSYALHLKYVLHTVFEGLQFNEGPRYRPRLYLRIAECGFNFLRDTFHLWALVCTPLKQCIVFVHSCVRAEKNELVQKQTISIIIIVILINIIIIIMPITVAV
jgi:hypothetical protein